MVKAVLEDYWTAPISYEIKMLLRYVEKVALRDQPVEQEDVDQLKRLGWSDAAIYDAVTVTALFSFYNRWVDGCGVGDMSDAMYAMSGKRLVKGYK